MNEMKTIEQGMPTDSIGSGVDLRRFVRRCFNCRHASKAFKLSGNTHHHCDHPTVFDGISEPSPWDSLREWHSSCKKWEVKP